MRTDQCRLYDTQADLWQPLMPTIDIMVTPVSLIATSLLIWRLYASCQQLQMSRLEKSETGNA